MRCKITSYLCTVKPQGAPVFSAPPRLRVTRMSNHSPAFPSSDMNVKRAAKYGFCSGVRIADLKVKRFAAGGGRGAILGQVVHNERVVEEMERLGVRTIDEIESVQEPTIV